MPPYKYTQGKAAHVPNPRFGGPKGLWAGVAAVTAAALTAAAQQDPFSYGTAQPPIPPPTTNKAPTAVSAVAANRAITLATNPIEAFCNGKIPDAIAQGKFNLNVRLRYEQVDQEGVPSITKNSYAPTIRTRFGYTTAPLYGFQAMLEGVNVSALGGDGDYNAAGSNGQNQRPVVGDPPLTRLDQAWVAYAYTNYVAVKAGQQRIVLDNGRFIGDAGWRQNMQTYGAANIRGEPLDGLDLYYGYIWYVHRVFGGVADLPPANTDFTSHSHIVNVSYSGWEYGQFVGYTYLLDLSNAAGTDNSCATYGGYFAGEAQAAEQVWLDYRAEFAWQTDYGDSPLHYGAEYYNLESGVRIKPVAVGAGYENLGSGANSGAGGGRASFRTPLASLHPFNGWDDVFLTTPADGLRDLYGYVQVTLPAEVPVMFVYHKFDAAFGGGNYGQEFDAAVSKKFGRYWTAMIKYAYYSGADAAPPSLTLANVDIQKFWAQVEFNF